MSAQLSFNGSLTPRVLRGGPMQLPGVMDADTGETRSLPPAIWGKSTWGGAAWTAPRTKQAWRIDRQGTLIAVVTGAGPGGTLGEHALHGPWLLRWGPGAALGGAVLAWLWDVLRPR
jgi:hypothetical protein